MTELETLLDRVVEAEILIQYLKADLEQLIQNKETFYYDEDH